uniref:Annexin n=1 Tax=Latimeria chalumnae TaxID=7897 RepID=H3APK8_LATCH
YLCFRFVKEMALICEILSKISLVDRPTAWGTLGTIRPFLNFEPETDAITLAEAIKAKGVDENTIVSILTNRTNTQRQQIVKVFNTLTQENLATVLQKALSGNLEKVILGLIKTPAQYDVQELKAAMAGFGTDEETLVEILATRNGRQLQEITSIYKQECMSEFEDDIKSDTGGDFCELLLTLAKGRREIDTGTIDYELISTDARALREAIMKSKSPDSKTWIHILTARSHKHLKRVFQKYEEFNSLTIEESINKRFKGDVQKGLLSLVQCIWDIPEYFANRICKGTKGIGASDKTLIRILISRCETDLLSIRTEFKKKCGKSLYSCIQSNTKGDYQSALLALCQGEDL